MNNVYCEICIFEITPSKVKAVYFYYGQKNNEFFIRCKNDELTSKEMIDYYQIIKISKAQYEKYKVIG